MMTVMAPPKATPKTGSLAAREESFAWSRYLRATSGHPLHRYLEIEPWAWANLQKRLQEIREGDL